MRLSQFDLRISLSIAGIPEAAVAQLSDQSYMPCQADWLTGDFHRWYFRALESLDVRGFQNESGDCDDYSDLFCALARVAHRRTPEGQGVALPIGRLHYLRAPNAPMGAQQGHAIVWAETSDAGLVFIEPQVLGRIERLTKQQLASCTRCSD